MSRGTTKEDSQAPHARATETYRGRPAGATPATSAVPWQRGDCLGRYVVLQVIGVGGMGVVYEAYDPELDRRVALKVLSTHGGQSDEASRLRLLREAQALARVVHPNVVAVHDVGSVDDQVFLAMELIEGSDLGEALRNRAEEGSPLAWKQVLELFLPAGRGLAAAHQAGLAHRDFKPSNVRVGTDGRVRVLDFGLALGLNAAPSRSSAELTDAAATADGSLFDVDLTRQGDVHGTPRYMAPEQRLGQRADARSDQYSFCVALWEALYGELPRGSEVGKTTQPVARSATPDGSLAIFGAHQRLQVLLQRGLRIDPAERFPSLDGLLDDLDAIVFKRRLHWRRWALLALVLVMALPWLWTLTPPPVCQGGEQRLAGVWDVQRRAAIGQAFAARGSASVAKNWRTVANIFDRYGEDWLSTYTEICEATHLRKEQTPELLDVRMACLEQRRQELGSLTDLFLRPSPTLLRDAVDVASRLGGLDQCAAHRLAAVRPPDTEDPDELAAIAALRQELARSWASQAAGLYGQALAELEPLLESVEATSYAPLQAEVRLALADLLELSGDDAAAKEAYRQAAAKADEGRYDVVRARAFLGLAWSSWDPNQVAATDRWLELARGTIRRLDDEPDLLMRWHQVSAKVASGQRQTEAAIEHAGQAVDLSEMVWGPEHLNTAIYLSTLASALSVDGRFEEALAAANRSAEIQRQILAEDDIRLSFIEHRAAVQELQLGRLEAAQVRLSHAAELSRGRRHSHRVRVLADLASVEARLGLDAAAMEHLKTALDLESELSGPRSAAVARLLNYFGDARLELADPQGAVPYLEEALAILDTHPDIPSGKRFPALVNLALARIQIGRPADAKPLLRRAAESVDPEDSWYWYVERATGLIALAEERPGEAVDHLAKALGMLTCDGRVSPLERPVVELQLARALAAAGDVETAQKYGEEARQRFRYLGRAGLRGYREADAWLETLQWTSGNE